MSVELFLFISYGLLFITAMTKSPIMGFITLLVYSSPFIFHYHLY